MSTAIAEPMDITNVLNNRLGAMVHHQHFAAYNDPHQLSFIKPEPTMDRSQPPHGSDHGYGQPQGMPRSYQAHAALQNSMHIPSSMANSSYITSFPDMPGMMSNMPMSHMPQHVDQHQQSQQHQQHQQMDKGGEPAKPYSCSNCSKRFARRSDLSRHERIHTGIRPHSCDFPGCDKQFIQRSALTVHKRVHTGEKPHSCEVCAKAFGDSSSLARHRRTHTGSRPYKCPYASCQKTFTRKTTLTRHQNHHTGTIEEDTATTAAALAAAGLKPAGQSRSEPDQMSSHGSPLSTPSPGNRTTSMSPGMDMPNGLQRHGSDFQYLQQAGTLPPHLRVGSPSSTTSSGYAPTNMRPTSHPTGYGPPPILEPSVEHSQPGNGSVSGSPHMSNVGWQSPSQVTSPSQNAAGYVYPDPASYPPNAAAMGDMYYAGAQQMRRPQSTEPGMVHMA